jgi:hypothetical protein
VGFGWLLYHLWGSQQAHPAVEVCVFKAVSGIPCPSCGTTRAMISVSQGQLLQAVKINPLGLLLAPMLFFLPVWVLSDLLLKRNSLFIFYQKTEVWLNGSKWTLVLIGLVLFNWIWNISKGL